MPRLLCAVLCGAAAGPLTLLVGLVAGCVDPKTDYNDWLSRTEDARSYTPPTVDAGPIEGALPDGGFTQTYFMACESQLAPGDPTKATLFTATLTFTPSGAGGGTLDYSNTPLVIGAQSLSQTVGDVATLKGVAVGADGKVDLVFGSGSVPPEANPVIPGQQVVFDRDTLHMIIGPGDGACANLDAHVTQPADITLVPSQNVCIYIPSSGEVTTLTQSMFDSSRCAP